LNLGHTKIAYLGNSLSGRTTLERQAGFKQALREAELAIPEDYLLQVSGASPEQGMVAIQHLLTLSDRPTAVVCYNDMLAIGAIRGLQQAGYQVPGDFSVTGFDNITFSAYTNPPLTTFDQPKRYIGAEAARLILGLLKSAGDKLLADEPTIRKLKGHLLVRASTGTPGSLTR
jgi:LacI family repressor for deo operon, udp, cdd, tsx, nupC, and nupG